MSTSRQRFLDTLDFKAVDKPWVRWGSFLWPETTEVWRTQGYNGEVLDDYFELDRLLRVDPWYGPVPEFRYEVIEETDETVTYVNHEGIVMKEFKEHATASMPQFLKFPVETESEFEEFAAARLTLLPGVQRIADLTLGYTADNFEHVWRTLWAMVFIASQTRDPIPW